MLYLCGIFNLYFYFLYYKYRVKVNEVYQLSINKLLSSTNIFIHVFCNFPLTFGPKSAFGQSNGLGHWRWIVAQSTYTTMNLICPVRSCRSPSWRGNKQPPAGLPYPGTMLQSCTWFSFLSSKNTFERMGPHCKEIFFVYPFL